MLGFFLLVAAIVTGFALDGKTVFTTLPPSEVLPTDLPTYTTITATSESVQELKASTKKPSGGCLTPQSTISIYDSYLDCYATAVTKAPFSLDSELTSGLKQSIITCFETFPAATNAENQCYFPATWLTTPGIAWSPIGPLGSCPTCLTFARTLANILVGATPTTSTCIRNIIGPAIAKEISYCIGESIEGFDDPNKIPDFEASQIPRNVLEYISLATVKHFQLDKCRRSNSTIAKSTMNCLANPPVNGFMRQHCTTSKNCDAQIAKSGQACFKDIARVKPVACQCFSSTSDALVQKIVSISNVLKNIYGNRTTATRSVAPTKTELMQCTAIIDSILKTSVNDWTQILNKIVKNCANIAVTTDYAANFLCNRMIVDVNSANGLNNLDLSVHGFAALAEALSSRLSRFCGGKYCK